jgi:hypothetical protein
LVTRLAREHELALFQETLHERRAMQVYTPISKDYQKRAWILLFTAGIVEVIIAIMYMAGEPPL